MTAHLHNHFRQRNIGRAGTGTGTAGRAAPEFIAGDHLGDKTVVSNVTGLIVHACAQFYQKFSGFERCAGTNRRAGIITASAFRTGVKSHTVLSAELRETGNTERFLFFDILDFPDTDERIFRDAVQMSGRAVHMRVNGDRDCCDKGKRDKPVSDPDKGVPHAQCFHIAVGKVQQKLCKQMPHG